MENKPSENKPFNFAPVIAVLALVLAIFGYWVWNQQTHKQDSKTDNTNQQQKLDPVIQAKIDEQKKFTSDDYGYEVQIPDGWITQNSSEGQFFVSQEGLKAQNENHALCVEKKPQCVRDFVPDSVAFSSKSMQDKAGDITTTTINGVEFKQFTITEPVKAFVNESSLGGKTLVFSSPSKAALDNFMKAVTFKK